MLDRRKITAPSSLRLWHCLRTQTKREHIAASILSNAENVEVFCPRISQIKKTRSGKKRFVDAMFPGYIFAKFNYTEDCRLVMHSQGVTRIVEHGGRRVVPEDAINDLKATVPEGVVVAPDPSLENGAEVEFVSGSLKGLNGKVLARLPSGQRVHLLLDFLGREIRIEADASDIMLAPEKG
ncbi:MAG: transcription termination/antitermination NusG family protein [Opitutales bacterium]